MRIMYLTESMGWSGGAQQLLWMAGAMQRAGHELLLTCQPGSEISTRATAAGLPVQHVRMRQDYDLFAAISVGKMLQLYRTQILHAQHSTAHAIGLMAAWGVNVPAFAVTRRVTFSIKHNLFSRLKYLSKRINGYVAVSQAVRDELLKASVAPSRIKVIPSVINFTPASAEDGQALRQELGLPLDRPVLMTVANYSGFKGHDVLLEALVDVVRAHPLVHVVIAGRDTETLQGSVDRLGLTSTVRLLGFRNDIPRLLAASTMFVFPSLQEAAGTALREAMAAGLPCVASRVGGIPESIEDGVRGRLVPPSDPQALAAAIKELLDHPARAAQLAKAGQAYVKEHFLLEPVARSMDAFYRRILP